MTEREKVLYDVAKVVYAALLTQDDEVKPSVSWDAAEAFYEEMLRRLGAEPEETSFRTK
jgi:hypothetical protein